MPCQRDVIYVYDGGLEGMLCCIFEAFEKKERPAAIRPEQELQPSLFEARWVETDTARAKRVAQGLEQKVSPRAAWVVQTLFLTTHPEKELLALDFTRLAFQRGRQVTAMMGHPVVSDAVLTARRAFGEAHQYKGLLRFSDVGGVLAAEIEPKNNVLPMIAPHFCARFRNESFLIYDRVHHAALIWQDRQAQMLRVDALTLPPPTADELQARRLWRQFYKTIAIEARINPRCQMSNMPKRYWNLLTEMQDGEEERGALAAAEAAGAQRLRPRPEYGTIEAENAAGAGETVSPRG
ncbi:TIGR03915 family putative DNA repair protein [Anaerofilum sp. BX8]|uniref:TIGR03915 family putative DNA repair protein n=1 Tax=Anaerofilum hominis TaxID=2763016 RepID=A0A923I7W9_9FIRM|nr:TIGR03915 family putative DNA repair protein [Anaerofilum hominis]MBC5580769.1 TIGR03915 family putative DNA repair protein [Anaerofilum hominis]